jgi:uncharacterized Tic20 family protein
MDQSTPPTGPGTPAEQTTMSADERNMGMLCHLLGLVGFLGPLIIWLLKKDQYAFVNSQGKESLNFQITLTICMMACWFLWFLIVPPMLIPLLWVLNLVFIIMGSVRASKGEPYTYPFAIRLVK